MTRRLAIVLTTSSIAGAALITLSWQGPAAAAGGTRTVTIHMATEAWYQEAPPCVALIDCSAVPASSPYPDDTLHVSLSAGDETARTYLAFTFALPVGGRLTDGTLTLPLDTDTSDGSLVPDEVDMVACLASEDFESVRGSLAAPPPVNCKVARGANYDKQHAAFTVDLSPFVKRWRTGAGSLALLSSRSSQQKAETWHAVFFATKKATKDEPPITATLTFAPKPSSGPNTGPPPVAGGFGSGGGAASSIPSFGGGVSGFGSFPSTTTTTTTQVESQPVAQTALPSVAGLAGPGFAYPMVWALPLLFLAGFGAIGRVLTRDLSRRGV